MYSNFNIAGQLSNQLSGQSFENSLLFMISQMFSKKNHHDDRKLLFATWHIHYKVRKCILMKTLNTITAMIRNPPPCEKIF